MVWPISAETPPTRELDVWSTILANGEQLLAKRELSVHMIRDDAGQKYYQVSLQGPPPWRVASTHHVGKGLRMLGTARSEPPRPLDRVAGWTSLRLGDQNDTHIPVVLRDLAVTGSAV